jgi:hypothetical protein
MKTHATNGVYRINKTDLMKQFSMDLDKINALLHELITHLGVLVVTNVYYMDLFDVKIPHP